MGSPLRMLRCQMQQIHPREQIRPLRATAPIQHCWSILVSVRNFWTRRRPKKRSRRPSYLTSEQFHRRRHPCCKLPCSHADFLACALILAKAIRATIGCQGCAPTHMLQYPHFPTTFTNFPMCVHTTIIATAMRRFVTGVRLPQWQQDLEEMGRNGTWAHLCLLPCTAVP